HGPAYQVLHNSWRSGDQVIGLLSQKLPANHQPENLPTIATPRLIELCFQTAGIWEMGVQLRMGLPYHIDRLNILRSSTKPDGPEGKMHAVVSPGADGNFNATVIDSKGDVHLTVEGYRTMELPNAVENTQLKPLKDIFNH
nr:hypothetical protein [Gammaproteobacteria bacterium]NIT53581.1 hypothetical protein [candidate division Zixibacteria bacterium]NIW45582.1 hypothetical protein [Gammaproteobacteria bacterium]NIX56805.1 hypothetical protein [candidate division Zixibacteria bacterium]